MKRGLLLLAWLAAVMTALAGCRPGENSPAYRALATSVAATLSAGQSAQAQADLPTRASSPATATATRAPSATLAPSLPTSAIEPANAARLKLLHRWGNGAPFQPAYSASGDRLALATSLGVGVYDAFTFAFSRFLPAPRPAYLATFSPDGARLAAGSEGAVWVWELASGALLSAIPLPGAGRVHSLAFSPDGSLLALCQEEALVVSVAEGQVLYRLEGSLFDAALAFSSDGNSLVIAGNLHRMEEDLHREAGVLTWQFAQGAVLSSFGMEAGLASRDVNAAAVAPGGQLVALGYRDGAVELWKSDGTQLRTLLSGMSVVDRLAFSADGGTLAASDRSNALKVWGTSDGEERLSLAVELVSGLALSPEGASLAFSDHGRVEVRQVEGGGPLHAWSFQGAIQYAQLSPDGEALLVYSDGYALYDLADGSLRYRLVEDPFLETNRGATFSPGGDRLAACTYTYEDDRPPVVAFWEAARGARERNFEGRWADWLLFTPPGDRLLLVGEDLEVMDADSGEVIQRIAGGVAWVEQAAIGPDGRLVAVADSGDWEARKSQVVVYDLAAGAVRYRLEHEGNVLAVVISPDGAAIASGVGRRVFLWNAADGAQSGVLEAPGEAGAWTRALAYSPDGRVLAQGLERTIVLWDVAAGVPLGALSGHSEAVTALAFTPDGRWLVSASLDGTVGLWGLD